MAEEKARGVEAEKRWKRRSRGGVEEKRKRGREEEERKRSRRGRAGVVDRTFCVWLAARWSWARVWLLASKRCSSEASVFAHPLT